MLTIPSHVSNSHQENGGIVLLSLKFFACISMVESPGLIYYKHETKALPAPHQQDSQAPRDDKASGTTGRSPAGVHSQDI